MRSPRARDDAPVPGIVASALGGGVRRAVAVSTVAKAGELVTLALLATIVPRRLGPSAFGAFSVALTLVTLGALALTLGGPSVMARFVPVAAPAERAAVARALGARLARARGAQVGAVGLVMLGVVLVTPVGATDAALVYAAFAANVAAGVALQVPLGLGRTAPFALRYPLQNAVLIVAVLALYPRYGLTGALVGLVVAAAAGLAFAVAALAPVVADGRGRATVPSGALRFGVVIAAAAALVQCVQRGGVVAVEVLARSDREVGYAALAIGVSLGLTYVVLQAFVVALPHLSARVADTGSAASSEATSRLLAGVVLGPILVATVLAAATAHTWVPAGFGPDYADAVEAFGPALAVVALAPLSALCTQVVALRLRPRVALAAGVVGVGTFLVVAVLGVPAWGATGATAAALAGAAAGALVVVAVLRDAVGTGVPAVSVLGAALVTAVAVL